MIATGILQRGVRRRFRLFKRRTYLAIDGSYVVKARNRVRSLVDPHDPETGETSMPFPETHTLALAGVITALGLTKYLYALGVSVGRLNRQLTDLLGRLHKPTVRDVANAINPRKPIVHTKIYY